MKKDLLLTSFVEFLILASGLLVYRLASQNLGSQGFSEYALTRRVISLIQPALILGMGVGIPRYIAYSYKDKKESDTFFIAGSFIIFSIALLSFLILNLFSESFAYIFFSYKNYHNLIFPVSLILIGLLLHALCYAYFRGSLKMLNANTLQLVNMSFVPIFSFFLSRSLEQILIYNGLLMIITSLSFYIPIFFHIKKEFTDIKKKVKTLLSYGLQRLPADFGMAGLLGLPAIITSHIGGVKEAGYLAFSISLLNMTGAVFAPLGLVMFPKASMLVASKDYRLLNHYVKRIAKFTFLLTLIGFIIFEVFADYILKVYLGKVERELIATTRIVFIGSFGYTMYVSMRSIVDALYEISKNTVNVLISLVVFIILLNIFYIFNAINYITTAFIISIILLGILTIKTVIFKIYER